MNASGGPDFSAISNKCSNSVECSTHPLVFFKKAFCNGARVSVASGCS
jgi:hypothetical protein